MAGPAPTPVVSHRPDGVTLINQQGVTGPNGQESIAYVDLGDATAVNIEVTPQGGGGPSASIIVEDSFNAAAFSQALDTAGYTPSTAGNLFSTRQKFNVTGTRRYVKVLLYVTGGTWVVTGSPVYAPNQENVTVAGTTTANQGTPNGGGANAWPVVFSGTAAVSSTDGALATIGATNDLATANTVIGRLKALIALIAGGLPAALGRTNMAGSLSVAIANDQATIPVNAVAAATGGDTPTLLRNLNATVKAIKASAGNLAGLQILNNQAAAAYIQIFDAATGSVTLATTVPVLEILVAATSQMNVPLPPEGLNFANAISIASTTTEFGAVGSSAGVHVNAQYA